MREDRSKLERSRAVHDVCIMWEAHTFPPAFPIYRRPNCYHVLSIEKIIYYFVRLKFDHYIGSQSDDCDPLPEMNQKF